MLFSFFYHFFFRGRNCANAWSCALFFLEGGVRLLSETTYSVWSGPLPCLARARARARSLSLALARALSLSHSHPVLGG